MGRVIFALFLYHGLIAFSLAQGSGDYGKPYSEDMEEDPQQFDIRLTGGRTTFEGLVEIYMNGYWTAVCDDSMRFETANVLCRMLGHASAISYHCCAEFGTGYGDYVFEPIRCEGHELSIEECYYRIKEHYYDESMISIYQCGHEEVVGLTCNPAEVRLKGGSNSPTMREGKVEVLHGNVWKAIYAESMDLNLAIVLCRMLDYSTAKSYHEHDWTHHRDGIINGSFQCSGEEEHFNDCAFVSGVIRYSNDDPQVAGVTCITLPVRLGDSDEENEGNVQVFYGDSWGNVCASSWSMNEANVVCRMLGYEGASAASPPQKNIFSSILKWVHCDGTERSLAHCNMSDFKRVSCRGIGLAAVRCSGEAVIPFRLSGGPDPSEGRVEMFYYGSWGTVCVDTHDFRHAEQHVMNDARVICRMLGYPNALDAQCCGHYGPGVGSVLINMPFCSGKESHLLSCRFLWQMDMSCNHFSDFGVTCQKNHDLEVRLVGGETPREGRVEVFYEETWGTICDDNWDLNDANVVCTMLGYERAESYSCCAAYGEGSGEIVFDDVECNGSEMNIGHCSRNKLGSHDCRHSEDVGVKCFGRGPILTTKTASVTNENNRANIISDQKAPERQTWHLSADKTLGLIITLLMLFIIVNIAIVVLSIKIHIYRRHNVTSDTM